MWFLDKSYLKENNVELVFMTHGYVYYQQTIDEYNLFLEHGSEGRLFYTGETVIKEFKNDPVILKNLGIKNGDVMYDINKLKNRIRIVKLKKLFNI